MKIGLNPIAEMHLKPDFQGTKLTREQLDRVLELTQDMFDGGLTVPGRDPWCQYAAIIISKHPEFAGIMSPEVRVTPENEQHLRTGFEARDLPTGVKELPVEVRRFLPGMVDDQLEEAHHLAVVLYSRHQLTEVEKGCTAVGEDYDIITVLATADPEIIDPPPSPATIARNALGPEFGGNGAPIDRDFYEASVRHHTRFAKIGAIKPWC